MAACRCKATNRNLRRHRSRVQALSWNICIESADHRGRSGISSISARSSDCSRLIQDGVDFQAGLEMVLGAAKAHTIIMHRASS